MKLGRTAFQPKGFHALVPRQFCRFNQICHVYTLYRCSVVGQSLVISSLVPTHTIPMPLPRFHPHQYHLLIFRKSSIPFRPMPWTALAQTRGYAPVSKVTISVWPLRLAMSSGVSPRNHQVKLTLLKNIPSDALQYKTSRDLHMHCRIWQMVINWMILNVPNPVESHTHRSWISLFFVIKTSYL